MIIASAYKPLPKQAAAHAATARHTGFGGAMGPGKTRWLCEEIRDLCARFPGNRALLGRADFTDFHKTTYISYLETENWDFVEQIHRTEHWIRYKNGSVVYLVGLKNWTDYLSGEFGAIGIDQAEELSEEAVNMLATRLRVRLPDGRLPHYRMLYTFNPTENWPKKWFVERMDQDTGQVYPESDYAFIESTPSDNPYLPDDYIETLERTLPDYLYRRFVLGDWESIPGRAFEDIWDENVHVIPSMEEKVRRGGWPVYRGIDHGSTAPTVCEWAAVDPKGNIIFFQEYERAGEVPSRNADNIAALSADYRIAGTWIDPRTQMTKLLSEQNTSRWSVYDEYQKHGISAVLARHPREMRLAAWRQGLKPEAMRRHIVTGELPAPRVYITEDCPGLLRSLPRTMIAHMGEDIEKKDDHWYDAGGFLLVGLLHRYLSPGGAQRNYVGVTLGY